MNKTKILKALKIYALCLIVAYSVFYILGTYWYWAMEIPGSISYKGLGFVAFCAGSAVALMEIGRLKGLNKL